MTDRLACLTCTLDTVRELSDQGAPELNLTTGPEDPLSGQTHVAQAWTVYEGKALCLPHTVRAVARGVAATSVGGADLTAAAAQITSGPAPAPEPAPAVPTGPAGYPDPPGQDRHWNGHPAQEPFVPRRPETVPAASPADDDGGQPRKPGLFRFGKP